MSDYSLLFVDDDEALLESFTKWFSGRGFDVTTAHHPSLALLTSAYKKFDVAVTDITLPEMNGIELIDELKKLGDFPIIVLSGDQNPKLRDVAAEHGVYRLLVKPVAMSALEAIVRESIEQAAALPDKDITN